MKTTIFTESIWGNGHGTRLGRELMESQDIKPGKPLQATVAVNASQDPKALSQRFFLQDKLVVFDPLAYGGEVMQDTPQGVEFLGRIDCAK